MCVYIQCSGFSAICNVLIIRIMRVFRINLFQFRSDVRCIVIIMSFQSFRMTSTFIASLMLLSVFPVVFQITFVCCVGLIQPFFFGAVSTLWESQTEEKSHTTKQLQSFSLSIVVDSIRPCWKMVRTFIIYKVWVCIIYIDIIISKS